MTLNSTIAAVAGAKGFNPGVFSLSRFLEMAHGLSDEDEVSPEAQLDELLGVTARSGDEQRLDALLKVN